MAELPCRLHCMDLDAYIVDRWRPTKHRLLFDSLTRTHMNSDSCVGYCLRLLSVDTYAFDLFFPFPSRTLPRRTRTRTDRGQLLSLISQPGYHADFFTFAEHINFEHSIGSSRPMITSRREANINKQTNSKVSLHSIVDKSLHFALPAFEHSVASNQALPALDTSHATCCY